MNSIKKILFVALVSLTAGVMLVSCSKAKYKKTNGGMPYQLFEGKDTQRVMAGDFIKIQFTQKIKDSTYFTTVGTLPQFQQVTDRQAPYDLSELWTSLKLGDSIVATQMLDTFIKRSPQSIPPHFKKGDKIISYIKILGIYKTDSAARTEYEKLNKDWLASEIKTIEQYLADKKITAQKTPSGAYVETLNPGTGNMIDSGNYVSVNYDGVSWSGKKFDSNIDTAFQHVGPYPFVVGTNAMIKGFDETVEMMRPGGKVRAYVPSILAYGGQPGSPHIKPYEMLIFEIEVVDVKDKMPAPATRAEQQQPQIQNIPQPNK